VGAFRLGSEPVERDVLGRIQRVVELEAVRVDREDRRFAPGDKLRPGAGFAAWRIHQLRILPGRAGRPDDRLGPGLEPADDLDAPMAKIGRNLIGDIGPLDAALCRPPTKHSLTQPGKPPARPPMIAGNASICRSSA
jgi:hypothetical protein